MGEEIGALPSIVAKTLILAGALGDKWAVVGNYVGSPECADLLEVTPVECGQEMYANAEWILLSSFFWLLPRFVDIMAGLTLTRV